ncbi:LysR substrate-binding domain-containing protein [Ottowia thiooxydans]|uniref:LysR substrate-binding domain-containing protein n=1 Tax=Ottowia thiooxydans TaxID=219182 RepID=UPI000414D558|nr:LysR substrate-binding domain-containing protein [Ottowia thiooxydans]
MDFRQIRYFIAVAEERHFRRAAEKLHISQPPLSQQIQALEKELGTVLLARNRRSVELTAAGEAFLRRARALVEQAASAATEARQIGRGDAGRLKVGFMSSAMLSRFAPLLSAIRGESPNTTIDLIQLPPKEQIEAIAAGAIDIGFLAIEPSLAPFPEPQARLNVSQIWEEELVAAVPMGHHLAGKPAIPLSALASEQFITLLRSPETGHYDQVTKLCEQRGGFRVKIGQEVEQLPAALALVAAGYGVSLMPACVTNDWIGLVAFVRLKERPRIPVTIVWRIDNASPVLDAFRRVLLKKATAKFYPALLLKK